MAPLNEEDEKLKIAHEAVIASTIATVNLRFVTLGSFVALNGLSLTGLAAAWAKIIEVPNWLLAIGTAIIALANYAVFLLERRTSDGHARCRRVGQAILANLGIRQELNIHEVAQVSPPSKLKRAIPILTKRPLPHGAILQWLYCAAIVVWLFVVFAAYMIRPVGPPTEVVRQSAAPIAQGLTELTRRVEQLEARLGLERRIGDLEKRVEKVEEKVSRRR